MSKCIYCKDREITNGIYFCDKCKKDIKKIGLVTGNVVSDFIAKAYWYLEENNGDYWKNDDEITMEDEREFQFIRPIDYIRFINYRNAIGEKEDSFAMSAEHLNDMEKWYIKLAEKAKHEIEEGGKPNNRQTKRALKSVNCIMDYLVTEEMSCSNTEWKDKDGYSFHTDIGYFDEGLIEFKKMLESKLKRRDK